MSTLHTLDRSWGNKKAFITVRKGDKYLHTVGEEYDLCECHTEEGSHFITGSAVVYNTLLVNELRDLSAVVLDMHYNEACKSYSGLIEALKKAYGDEVSDSMKVTVVFLRRLQ